MRLLEFVWELARTAARLRQIASLNPEMAVTVTYKCKQKMHKIAVSSVTVLLEFQHRGVFRIVCAAKLCF